MFIDANWVKISATIPYRIMINGRPTTGLFESEKVVSQNTEIQNKILSVDSADDCVIRFVAEYYSYS